MGTALPSPTINEGSSVDDAPEGDEDCFMGWTTVARSGGLALNALVCGGTSECMDPPREENEVDLHDKLEFGAWMLLSPPFCK